MRFQAEGAVRPAIRRTTIGSQQGVGRAEAVVAEVAGVAAAVGADQVAVLLLGGGVLLLGQPGVIALLQHFLEVVDEAASWVGVWRPVRRPSPS